jgi:hypothetical protein
MIGAGTFINPLLKIVTTVVILGAIYLFFVKPILDTTNDAINTARPAFNDLSQAQQQAGRQLRQAGIDQQRAIQIAGDAQNNANKLLNCIQAAKSDVDKIAACGQKFGP